MQTFPLTARRSLLQPIGFLADANFKLRHPAELGTWIWHPDKAPSATAILRFRLSIKLVQPLKVLLHVTADQRFQLRCNGERLTFGPDRCDLEHWTVHSLEVDFPAGEYEIEALAWHIEASAEEHVAAFLPMAQMSWRGAFLLFVEGPAGAQFNTGEAPWVVDDLTGAVSLSRQDVPGYHVVGAAFEYDLQLWSRLDGKSPTVIRTALDKTLHGVRRSGWCIQSATLAEQRSEEWTGGSIRAVREEWSDGPYLPQDADSPGIGEWQPLLNAGSMTIPPHSKREVIWDFESYRCGYAMMEAQGSGATIEWSWAEGLYAEQHAQDISPESHKHHRGEIANKVFIGLKDSWRIDAESLQSPPALWWRCGRYVRLRIETAESPLTIGSLGVRTTGYPLEDAGAWASSDQEWDQLIPLFKSAFRCAAHETWTDTPYYEQMCYVGDNIICALSNYVWFKDSRLSRRSIELFGWSRRASGLVAERYPSRERQESATFALLWPCMVRDYAWWQEDGDLIRSLLPSLRSLLAEFEGMTVDGLLREVPGWPFIDWCPEWLEGCGPGVREGDSSIVNLHWLLALQAAAQVENVFGDAVLAKRSDSMARQLFSRILDRYWDAEWGLLKDTISQDTACEYAQALALRTGLLDEEKTRSCLTALKSDTSLVKATIYGSFYILDALYLNGEEAEFHRRLESWRDLPAKGFTSTPEQGDPSRSDAHPWGAHPAWHTLASVAGVRSTAAGFSRVRVTPCPGSLTWMECMVNHPRGAVKVALEFSANGALGSIELPDGVSGEFSWQGQQAVLLQGFNVISLP